MSEQFSRRDLKPMAFLVRLLKHKPVSFAWTFYVTPNC